MLLPLPSYILNKTELSLKFKTSYVTPLLKISIGCQFKSKQKPQNALPWLKKPYKSFSTVSLSSLLFPLRFSPVAKVHLLLLEHSAHVPISDLCPFYSIFLEHAFPNISMANYLISFRSPWKSLLILSSPALPCPTLPYPILSHLFCFILVGYSAGITEYKIMNEQPLPTKSSFLALYALHLLPEN